MATILEPMITAFMGPNPPVRVRFWDGSTLGPEEAEATLIIRSPRAVRRIMYAPGELGAARAYVAGELDLEGDVYAALALRDALAGPDRQAKVGLGMRAWLDLLRAAGSSGAENAALGCNSTTSRSPTLAIASTTDGSVPGAA